METDVKKLQKELKNIPGTIQKAMDKHSPSQSPSGGGFGGSGGAIDDS